MRLCDRWKGKIGSVGDKMNLCVFQYGKLSDVADMILRSRSGVLSSD